MPKPTTKMKKHFPENREVILIIGGQKYHLTFATLMIEMEQLDLFPGPSDVFEGIQYPEFGLKGTLAKYEITDALDKQRIFDPKQLDLLLRCLSSFKIGGDDSLADVRSIIKIVKSFSKADNLDKVEK